MNSDYKMINSIYTIEKFLEADNLGIVYLCNTAEINNAIYLLYKNCGDPSVIIQDELIQISRELLAPEDCSRFKFLVNERDSYNARVKAFNPNTPYQTKDYQIYKNLSDAWIKFGLVGAICSCFEDIPFNEVPWSVLRSYDCLATEIKKTFLNNLLQKLLTLKSK